MIVITDREELDYQITERFVLTGEKDVELALNMLAEATTVELSKSQNPKGFRQSAKVAHEGGKIAGETRAKIESQTGRSIVSKEKATDYLPPADRWEALPEEDGDE